MDDPKAFFNRGCECQKWARQPQKFFTTHHYRCPHYDPEGDARVIIEDLIKGILSWAREEDGIHPECFEAFTRGALVVGRYDLLSEKKNDG
jgi:hypothetical protein